VPAIGGSKGRKNQKTTPLQQLSIAVIETPAELKQLASKKKTQTKSRGKAEAWVSSVGRQTMNGTGGLAANVIVFNCRRKTL